MKSRATRRFWDLFYALPFPVQALGCGEAQTITWVWIGSPQTITGWCAESSVLWHLGYRFHPRTPSDYNGALQ